MEQAVAGGMLSGHGRFCARFGYFVRDHQLGRPPSVLLLAFANRSPSCSLLIPACGALGLSGHDRRYGISFWPIWLAGGRGSALATGLPTGSSSLRSRSRRCGAVASIAYLLPRREAFVKSWACQHLPRAVFGPLRSSCRWAAGIFRDPYWVFSGRQLRFRPGLVGCLAVVRRCHRANRRMALCGACCAASRGQPD